MFVPGAVAAQVTSDTPSSNPSALAPTPTRRLTLTEALSLAETANPALRTKLAQLDAAQGVRTEASALLYNNPELSTELTRRTVPQSGQGDERRREWNVGVAQTLEIAGQQGHRREAAESALAALQSEIDDARLTARSAAAIAFYRALAAQERVVLEAQALKLFESTSAAIQKRRSAGEDTKLDANIAAVEAERARNQLAIAQEQLLSARSELSTATQLPPETLPEAIGELTMTPKAFCWPT
jgi:cobalt-zinc-cadmium efflux system outer membrane protein